MNLLVLQTNLYVLYLIVTLVNLRILYFKLNMMSNTSNTFHSMVQPEVGHTERMVQ